MRINFIQGDAARQLLKGLGPSAIVVLKDVPGVNGGNSEDPRLTTEQLLNMSHFSRIGYDPLNKTWHFIDNGN